MSTSATFRSIFIDRVKENLTGVVKRRLVVSRGSAPPVSRDFPADFIGNVGWVAALDDERVTVELMELDKGSTPNVIAISKIILGRDSTNGVISVTAISTRMVDETNARKIRGNQIGSPTTLS